MDLPKIGTGVSPIQTPLVSPKSPAGFEPANPALPQPWANDAGGVLPRAESYELAWTPPKRDDVVSLSPPVKTVVDFLKPLTLVEMPKVDVAKDPAGAYDTLKTLVEQRSPAGSFKTGAEERNLVAFRNPTAVDANNRKGDYDDRMYMVWTDKKGVKHAAEYTANTDPSGRYEDMGKGLRPDGKEADGDDANSDGRLDVGRLPAGHYEFTKGRYEHLNTDALIPAKPTFLERDVDHNGQFDDGWYSSDKGTVLIHPGGNSITGSAGCQTLKPAEFDRLWTDLGATKKPVGYTLFEVKPPPSPDVR